MSTIENYLQLWIILKVGKGKLSITKKKKNYQKSRPKIMSADVDQLQRKWSLLRPHVIWMDI